MELNFKCESLLKCGMVSMGDMDDSKVRLSNFDLDFATQFKVTVNYDHLVQNMSLIMLGSRLETQEST